MVCRWRYSMFVQKNRAFGAIAAPKGKEEVMKENTPFSDNDALRPHSYDGIQEYDKRLPNWWLFTLYGAIVFSVGYWAYYHWTGHMKPGYARVEQQIEAYQKAALNNGATPTNAQLWKLSRDPAMVEAGEKTYMTTCAACHGNDLKGGIGQNLTDNVWLHGGNPSDIYNTVTKGVAEKGMPTWGPVLGAARITEVVAFVISKNSTIAKPAD